MMKDGEEKGEPSSLFRLIPRGELLLWTARVLYSSRDTVAASDWSGFLFVLQFLMRKRKGAEVFKF